MLKNVDYGHRKLLMKSAVKEVIGYKTPLKIDNKIEYPLLTMAIIRLYR